MNSYSNIIYDALRNAYNVYLFKDELSCAIVQYKINLDNENRDFFEKFHSNKENKEDIILNNSGLLIDTLSTISLNDNSKYIKLNDVVDGHHLEELIQNIKSTFTELSRLPLSSQMITYMVPGNNDDTIFLKITY